MSATDTTNAAAGTESVSGSGAAASDAAAGPAGLAGPAGGRGGHDWHDAGYVRRWVEENESRADSRRPQFDLLADHIPHPADAALRILDVGAGWGPVTRHLLERFPNASATLLDYSDEMYGEAKPRLAAFGERVRYVLGDLSAPGAFRAALAAAGGRFDAIVSSSCIHNVRPTERIPALYREVREATAPGGCFLNLDMVGTASPLIQAATRRVQIERRRRQRHAETGNLPSYAEIEAELAAQREGRREQHQHQHNPADASGGATPGAEPNARTSGGSARTLLDHLTWLRDAGFNGVECFWRQDNRALIGGYVAT
jgi:ubiquinone/menaquinone biosynthesis C-methylase UbiE